jgi:cold shock CspA family protein
MHYDNFNLIVQSIEGGDMKNQNDERKYGVIRSWNLDRGFGIVRVGPASSLERYFLHVSEIRTGTAEPTPGMTVEFYASPEPVKQGNLPKAIDANIDVGSITAVQL